MIDSAKTPCYKCPVVLLYAPKSAEKCSSCALHANLTMPSALAWNVMQKCALCVRQRAIVWPFTRSVRIAKLQASFLVGSVHFLKKANELRQVYIEALMQDRWRLLDCLQAQHHLNKHLNGLLHPTVYLRFSSYELLCERTNT